MCILSFLFKKLRKDSEPVKSVKKRDYKSAPGRYAPRYELVRLDNVAIAAGVCHGTAMKCALKKNIEITQKGCRKYIGRYDAIYLHSILWNQRISDEKE